MCQNDLKDKYQIPFTNACIRAFAKRFNQPVKQAFQYLCEFGGAKFLIDYYSTLHLQSIEDTVNDMIIICKNNGGYLQ
ncbi:MAG: DUF3791 domain-containing protein [Bacteroidales bacterium]|nr:DUF3791 domain-containing protein [Bacteroidales bacterium]